MGSLHTWDMFINTQLTCTAGEKSRSESSKYPNFKPFMSSYIEICH